MTASIILSVEAGQLHRNGKALLSDISLAIRNGETAVIMGHNGAGKTLLLQAINGLVPLQSGAVRTAATITQKIVFQKPVLLRRSARAHFTFACALRDEALCQSWFAKAGLLAKIDVPARRLSSGEAQKLALISALAASPDILLLDEPTANLDAESRAEVEALIIDAKQSGMTIVMVTHAYAQAERLADRIIFMQKGMIYDDAPASAFLSGTRSQAANLFLQER